MPMAQQPAHAQEAREPRDCERNGTLLGLQRPRPAVEHSLQTTDQRQFGRVPRSFVRIFIVPLRTHSACSALAPVPLGTLIRMS